MMALDCASVTFLPPGPSLSTITGIWPIGFSARNSGRLCSPFERSIMELLSLESASLVEPRAEGDDADRNGGEHGDQHGAGGDVLRLPGEGMKAGGCQVGE